MKKYSVVLAFHLTSALSSPDSIYAHQIPDIRSKISEGFKLKAHCFLLICFDLKVATNTNVRKL